MRNRLVPRSEWFRFFDEFSRRHLGRLATVHVLSPKIGSQVEARDLPFEGIVSRADATGPISIHLGSSVARHVEHEIERPTQVWVELTEGGADQALDVESEGGTKTVVEFRAARPRPGL